MCLDRLKKFKASRVGWKCINIDKKNNIHPLCRNKKIKFHPWKWNKDTKKSKIRVGYLQSYPCGFHVSIYKKDALTWKSFLSPNQVVKKVEYRKIVVTGYQWNEKVVVAKEFRFIKDK